MRRRTSTIFTALAVCAAAAASCGGKSSTHNSGDGDGASTGNGDGDGTGATIGDGDDIGSGGFGLGNTGGSGTGGAATGGQPSTGGEPSTGGSMPTGGSSGEVLVTLGDDCFSAGSFACAENNPKLALICGGDGKWAARETCTGDALCDFNPGLNQGTCRSKLPECAATSNAFCDQEGNRMVICREGGFETEVVEECGVGFGCQGGGCALVDDPCAGGGYTCVSDCGTVLSQYCYSESGCTNSFWGGTLYSGTPTFVRVPNKNLCNLCSRPKYGLILHEQNFPDKATKFTVGPGWGMVASSENGQIDYCAEPVEGCVVVPPVGESNNTYRAVFMIPLVESPPLRNVRIDVVEPGTTCD